MISRYIEIYRYIYLYIVNFDVDVEVVGGTSGSTFHVSLSSCGGLGRVYWLRLLGITQEMAPISVITSTKTASTASGLQAAKQQGGGRKTGGGNSREEKQVVETA